MFIRHLVVSLAFSVALPTYAFAIADDFTFVITDLETDEPTRFINQKLNEKLKTHPIYEVAQATDIIVNTANEMNVDPIMLLALIENESSYNANAVGGAGEIGLMQVRPRTAKWILEKKGKVFEGREMLFKPSKNIAVGMIYLKYLHRTFKSPQATMAAFNMGPGNVKRLMRKNIIPRTYFRRVKKRYVNLRAELEMSARPQVPFVVASN